MGKPRAHSDFCYRGCQTARQRERMQAKKSTCPHWTPLISPGGTNGKCAYTARGSSLKPVRNWPRKLHEVLPASIVALAGAAITIGALAIAAEVAAWEMSGRWECWRWRRRSRKATSGSGRTRASISPISILLAACWPSRRHAIVAAVSTSVYFQPPYMRWAVYTCSAVHITRGDCGLAASIVAGIE